MRDNQLLQDLDDAGKIAGINFAWLGEQKITTYKQLFAFMRDEQNDPKSRSNACFVVVHLRKYVDKRQAVVPMLSALNSKDKNVRSSAIRSLGLLDSKRAVIPLMKILGDYSESEPIRHEAIDGLSSIMDARALPLFWQIIDDKNEPIDLRSRAIEMMFERPEPVERLIALLKDPIPDIRFWAAYALASFSPREALSELDHIAAYDHTLPTTWGWHVDREALLPLETIYYRKILGFYDHRQDEDYPWYGMSRMYLISPAPEYTTVEWRYRNWQQNWTYTTETLPEIKLRVDPNWLAEKLKDKWSEIRLNVREPHPQAYLLDWHLQVDSQDMIGGLHRDQYGVVITGDRNLRHQFAAWYRSLFSKKQHLYLYEWAEPHLELKPGMTPDDIEKASDRRHSVSATEIRNENLTFG